MQSSQRLNSRTCCAGDHDVGGASLNDRHGFGDRQVGRCFSHGQAVAGATKLIVNGDVACGHIWKVFQQPEWFDFGQSVFGPLRHLEFLLIVQAALHATGELFGARDDVIATEQGSNSRWVAAFFG